MKLMSIRKGMFLLSLLVIFSAVFTGGCDGGKLQACREENQMLSRHIEELEFELAQADAAKMTAMPAAPTPASVPAPTSTAAPITYTVVKGDTLWRIAERQLGNGARYKEILNLNPQLSPETLTPGTTIKLPAR